MSSTRCFMKYHAIRLVTYFTFQNSIISNLAGDKSKKVTEKIRRENDILREVRDTSTFPVSV